MALVHTKEPPLTFTRLSPQSGIRRPSCFSEAWNVLRLPYGYGYSFSRARGGLVTYIQVPTGGLGDPWTTVAAGIDETYKLYKANT